ncbi:MAG: TadE/TadG family type IV pilus assembly protein [Rubrimonas sp.]|uniref:TadE/TadG family type IV pilus assembly protein n=1 Tax=Rubrimonas sp. TaxID=2036015 RepID=UPI002FDDE76A
MKLFGPNSTTCAARKAGARFLSHRRGNVALLFGLAALPLMASIGLAVDAGRAYLVQNRMAKALDAAGLAAARVVLEERAAADARRFFDANFPPGYLGAKVTDFRYGVDDSNDFITVEADVSVPTVIMQLFGRDTVQVADSAMVERMNRGLELALVMDNTGSMRSSGKIGAMRTAATDLVNILFGDADELPLLWISVVPYTATVNIGGGRTGWLALGDRARTTPSGFEPTSWKGCVEARSMGGDERDDPPADDPFDSFFYAPDTDNIWDPADPDSIDDSNGAQNNGTGPNLGCGPAITSLTNQKATVTAAIAEMLPWHRGGTTSNLGMVWGWRTISPRWRDLWGGPTPAEMPFDYFTPLMDKAVVLLTDGDNVFYDHPPTGPDGSDYTAYGRLNDLGYTSIAAGNTELDSRLARMCEAMKDEGVLIYTITFGGSPNAATQTLYRDCATEPSGYFHAPDAANLSTAFRSIGQRLSNLRIVQ